MDPIANMLTSISNAASAGKKRLAVPYSSYKEKIAKLMQEQGVVASYRIQEGTPAKIILVLAYEGTKPKIMGVERLSKPGQRRFVGKEQLPYTGKRPGFYLVSTSAGLLTSEAARKKELGGELVGVVWSR